MVQVSKTDIEGVLIISPQVFGDDRGYFMETYNAAEFKAKGIPYDFVQDNQSKSCKGVLRGLHYQIQHPQAKLVRVLEGEVFDVAVDLRRGSPTYGKWVGVTLSGENKKMFMIPRGFAHGFVVLSDTAVFAYKCDDFYHPNDEGGIMWNDPTINIQWPFDGEPLLSAKDKAHPAFAENIVSFDVC
jgi:dTDP-4-dehydrorhamnose 3,5-epimerase